MRNGLIKAVGEIYDAADDASKWEVCLPTIGSLFRGTSTNLIYHNHHQRLAGSLECAVGADPEMYRWYRAYGQSIDPWALALRPGQFRAGQVTPGTAVIDHARLKRTEFYADMGKRHGTTRALAGVLEASAQHIGVLAVNRDDRGEEFDAREVRMLGVLVPHVRRALAIHRRIGNLFAERTVAADAMDQARRGIILLDGRGRVLFANRYAARLLGGRDGLVVDGRFLRATTPASTRDLRAAIGLAVAVTRAKSLEVPGLHVALPRQKGQPLRVAVTPVSRANQYLGRSGQVAAIVFVVDPDDVEPSTTDRLQALFGLTPAEAKAAAFFANGHRVDEIADELLVSRETVRTHVKRVLSKSGARTQADFVRMVWTGPAGSWTVIGRDDW